MTRWIDCQSCRLRSPGMSVVLFLFFSVRVRLVEADERQRERGAMRARRGDGRDREIKRRKRSHRGG